MRIMGAAVIGLLATGGVSQASSFVVLGVSTSTPSIIKLKAIDKPSAASAPSMIALGDPVPAVTDEKVAAIPTGHQPAPMIIRGGVVGSAFATPTATAAAKPAAPANGTAPTTPANGTAASSNGAGKTNNQPTTAAANAPSSTQPQTTPVPRVGKAM